MESSARADLLKLYPEFNKVFGPYVDKNNEYRTHVVLTLGRKKRRTISLPKAMVEIKLGRHLDDDEWVDHIDDDPTNNVYENFQILTPAENVAKAQDAGRMPTVETAKFDCPHCGTTFTKYMRDVRRNQIKRKNAGPFCSKRCAGKFQFAGVG